MTLAFWTVLGLVVGCAVGILAACLLLLPNHVTTSTCGLFDGLVAAALTSCGVVAGTIKGVSHANGALNQKYGAGWRRRIRNRTLQETDSP